MIARRLRVRAARAIHRGRRWYGRLPFARKLALFPTLTATALGLVLVVTVCFGLAGERRLVALGTVYYPQVERARRLGEILASTERALQDAATTDDRDFLARADSLAHVYDSVAAGVTSASDRSRLRGQFDDYYAQARAITVRLSANEVGDDIASARVRLVRHQRTLHAALDAAARATRATMFRVYDTQRRSQRLAWTAALVITFAFVLAVMALARLATRMVTVPLRQVVDAADRIAAGDLGIEVVGAGDDEVGHLMRSMGRMVLNLRAGERRLLHLAYHDALTGLPNRARFRQRLARAASEPGGRATLAVLYVDLDDFKGVNDSFGHAAGDLLLREVAERLLRATRGCDTVARLGGDEFAVLLRGVPTAGDAVVVADRVSRALAVPIDVHGTELRTCASVGIAIGADALDAELLTPTSDPAQAAEDLLRFADTAMYAAKSEGKGHHVVFEPDMHRRAQERRALEHDLRVAVERHELRVYFQPIVRLDTGEIVSAEALVRWAHPLRGLVPPNDFIPLAERTGLIAPIGRWVLEAACQEAARWRAAHGDRAPTVSVNLSASQLHHGSIADEVRRVLALTGLPASSLVLEITETAMLADNDGAIAQLLELRNVGVTIAVDDFGTGYSSLSYVQRLPLDVLKIDQSFVCDVAVDGEDPVLTRAIIALGGALGVRVVAEGIERPAQAAALRAMGCVLGQGFHFARPEPAQAFALRLRTQAEESMRAG